MSDLCEQMETKAVLDAARAATALSSIALRDKCFDQSAKLPFLVETAQTSEVGINNSNKLYLPHFLVLPGVNDASDVRNGDTLNQPLDDCLWPIKHRADYTSFRDVRSDNDLTNPARGNIKHRCLVLA